MNLSTLEIPESEAREKLAEYEAVLRTERTAEDAAIAAGYRAAARGLPVISLRSSVRAGGLFANGLPKIAVVRADAGQVEVQWDGSDLVYYGPDGHRNLGALVGKNTVRVRGAIDRLPLGGRRVWRGTTIVPLIPPKHRPRPRRLRGCHLLWEVEEWAPVPPRDPALIRHIRGDLWAVLAVWDLTDLERYVLGQRS